MSDTLSVLIYFSLLILYSHIRTYLHGCLVLTSFTAKRLVVKPQIRCIMALISFAVPINSLARLLCNCVILVIKTAIAFIFFPCCFCTVAQKTITMETRPVESFVFFFF